MELMRGSIPRHLRYDSVTLCDFGEAAESVNPIEQRGQGWCADSLKKNDPRGMTATMSHNSIPGYLKGQRVHEKGKDRGKTLCSPYLAAPWLSRRWSISARTPGSVIELAQAFAASGSIVLTCVRNAPATSL